MTARPLEQIRDEFEQRCIGPLHVLEDEHDRAAFRESFEEETPPCEQLGLLEIRACLERQQLGDARPDPRAFLGVLDGGLENGVELRPRSVVVLALGDTRAHANHLGERPVRHAVAVGEAPAAVPGHVLGDAVEILVELPARAATCRCRRCR